MDVVIDTSAVLAVLLDEPERPALLAVTRAVKLIAPASLPWETGNALVAAVRRRRLSPTMAGVGWAAYQRIPIQLVDVDVAAAITIACDFGLYAYDAYMLELARRRTLPLLTLDARLRVATRQANVALVEI